MSDTTGQENTVDFWKTRALAAEASLEEKLTKAKEALTMAKEIMDYCQGDAWEREATEEDRKRFRELHDTFIPPRAASFSSFPAMRPKSPKEKCPDCGKKVAVGQGLWEHRKGKHGFLGTRKESQKIAKQPLLQNSPQQ